MRRDIIGLYAANAADAATDADDVDAVDVDADVVR